MSISLDHRLIECDGPDCKETAPIPVALRAELFGLLPIERGARGGIDGWLFVRRDDHTEHYCPSCNRVFLSTLTQEISQ